MPSNLDNHKSSTTAPPVMGDNGGNASEHNSALTVGLSGSGMLAGSNEKNSVLTTEAIASNLVASPMSSTSAPDATVIRNRTDRLEFSSTHSLNGNSLSADISPNSNVEIVSDNILESSSSSSSFQLGDYQVIDLIGGGGMGRIYRARDVRLDRDVALKILAPNQQSEEFRERFIIEAKASAKLHHDNIVSVYAFGQTDGVTYLVMEYISGSNIRDIVTKKGPLPIEDVLSYAIQMASALEHIKEKGIVHRDIKPSNVLITEDGTVKVIDLGLAKNILEPDNDLTQTGVTLGTYDYISPEQARDPRNVDIRSDIYSLGCSLFFMLTGQPPYPKGTGLQKLLRHQGVAAPNVQDLRPDVPAHFADIIMRCMAKDADMRYQTPQDLSKALYIAAEEQGMRPIGISLSKWYLPSISRLRIWKDRLAWAIPIVLLIIVIMILDCFWKPDQRQSEFLPETPGLKRNVAAVNSGGRTAPIFGMPVKKGKILELDRAVQSVPPLPEEPVPNESEPPQAADISEEPNEAVDDNQTPVVQRPAIQKAKPSKTVQPIRESGVPAASSQDNRFPESSNNPVKIHSVKLETD